MIYNNKLSVFYAHKLQIPYRIDSVLFNTLMSKFTVYTHLLTEFFTPHLQPQIGGSVNTRDIQNIGHRLSNLVDLQQLSKL